MSNDIDKLRGHLFETLQALRDPDKPMDIDRAKAVCEVGSVIIDAAKAEIDFARVNGSVNSSFFHKPPVGQPALSAPAQSRGEFDSEFDEQPAETSGKHKTATGVVDVNVKNGQRIITHTLK